MHLLLLSNSRNPGREYLEHARESIRDLLGSGVREVLFVPYASVRLPWGQYAASVREAFSKIGCGVRSIADESDPSGGVRSADAILVGGGNTFRLLGALQEKGLLDPIRARVREGLPYIGWSAGSNVACPTIMTTNDMPVVPVRGFDALGLVPFQINPHYTNAVPEGHQGETRDERIAEFVEMNPGRHVVGLREGSSLRVEGRSVVLEGVHPARVFVKGKEARDCTPGEALGFLLEGDGA